ncbi:division/cell wall cluster transcriptional repressor MraZ [Desulfovibrio litoralis]|uniref:Transcriptional regulator MraZ n=1 Tax=Desulfovibrio litoralis DSM 11393 TaxID=1121455 RepID=A0A1M7SLG4_9BACT|nr:division/cell wall cluster transcriptional repressor MraZ [Desulfovibrio litoralis]SHN59294.1 MraZ protein [Desulfovibrio litoralis DSM 11393]
MSKLKLFRGRFSRSVDDKGRLMLPTELRSVLESRSESSKIIFTTYDGCIVGFPLPDWEQLEEAFYQLKNPPLTVRNFRRLVIGGAEECNIDAQGRVRLSKTHLEYSGIESELIIVGQGQKLELWQPQKLEEVLKQDYDVASLLAESGVDFSF